MLPCCLLLILICLLDFRSSPSQFHESDAERVGNWLICSRSNGRLSTPIPSEIITKNRPVLPLFPLKVTFPLCNPLLISDHCGNSIDRRSQSVYWAPSLGVTRSWSIGKSCRYLRKVWRHREWFVLCLVPLTSIFMTCSHSFMLLLFVTFFLSA